jgi:hypothetical protein
VNQFCSLNYLLEKHLHSIMRILCLHGRGSNNDVSCENIYPRVDRRQRLMATQIFKMQTGMLLVRVNTDTVHLIDGFH